MPSARLEANAEGGGPVLTGLWLFVAAVFEGWPEAEPGILLGRLVLGIMNIMLTWRLRLSFQATASGAAAF